MREKVHCHPGYKGSWLKAFPQGHLPSNNGALQLCSIEALQLCAKAVRDRGE